jgi:hypothetical protein
MSVISSFVAFIVAVISDYDIKMHLSMSCNYCVAVL